MAHAFPIKPLRNWRPGPAAQLVFGLSTALAAALLAVGPTRIAAQIEGDRGIAPVATSTDIHVTGIEVNVKARNAAEAREKAWTEAQRKAWASLNGPQLSDGQLDSLVSAVVIEKEQIGPRRYIARLGIIFERTKAAQFLGAAGGDAARSRSAPMLLIPVLHSGGVRQVFEVRGLWQRAWAAYQPGASPIDYVRPTGAGGESLILTAGQTGRRSRSWWRTVLDQFEASDDLIPVARLEREWPGGPVKGTFTARYGPDNTFLESFTLTAPDEDAVPEMLARAVVGIDAAYRRALAQGLLRPDPTLMTEQAALDAVLSRLQAAVAAQRPARADEGSQAATGPAAGEAATGPETPPVASFTVQFATPDAAAVDAALGSVRSAARVQSAVTTSLAIGGTSVMRVTVAGDLETLAAALRAQGWQVSVGAGALRISR